MQVSSINVVAHCSHELSKLVGASHPCGRLHGHSYHISVEMSYDSVPDKLLADFGKVKDLIKDRYDHRHLNDVMSMPPTAENMGRDIYEHLTKHLGDAVAVRHVTVAETDNNISTYIPEEDEEEEE